MREPTSAQLTQLAHTIADPVAWLLERAKGCERAESVQLGGLRPKKGVER